MESGESSRPDREWMKVQFTFISPGGSVQRQAGRVRIESGSMRLEVECDDDDPYRIVGRPTNGVFSGEHTGGIYETEVRVTWAQLGEDYLGLWKENDVEWIVRFAPKQVCTICRARGPRVTFTGYLCRNCATARQVAASMSDSMWSVLGHVGGKGGTPPASLKNRALRSLITAGIVARGAKAVDGLRLTPVGRRVVNNEYDRAMAEKRVDAIGASTYPASEDAMRHRVPGSLGTGRRG